MDKVITERELILPALISISEQTSGLTTTQLIQTLREKMNPQGRDLEILTGRKDDVFSQKVRNLISHKTIAKYTDIRNDKLCINEQGLQFIVDSENNQDDYSPYIEANDDFRDENVSINDFGYGSEPDNIYLSVSDLKRKYDRWQNGKKV